MESQQATTAIPPRPAAETAARTQQLYSEFRFDRARLLEALDCAVADVKEGRSPAAMSSLLGAMNAIAFGMHLMTAIQQHLATAAEAAGHGDAA